MHLEARLSKVSSAGHMKECLSKIVCVCVWGVLWGFIVFDEDRCGGSDGTTPNGTKGRGTCRLHLRPLSQTLNKSEQRGSPRPISVKEA